MALCGYAGTALFMPLAAAGVAFLTGVPKIAAAMAGISFCVGSFASVPAEPAC
jgi:hypothetical protein